MATAFERANLIACGRWLPVVLCLVWPASLRAATPSLRLTPALSDVVLSEVGEIREIPFTIFNETAVDEIVDLSVVDFGPLGETGGLAFIGTENQSWSHRLSGWLTLDQRRVTISARSSAQATVRLENRSDLTPGGHYAAVLASLATEDADRQPDIGWQGVLSTQFYVLKKGGETYNLDLLDVKPSGTLWRRPATLSLRWRAGGNTHVIPYGEITISSAGGQVVGRGIINEDSAIILPESTRVIAVRLDNQRWWPGRYKTTISFHHQAVEEVQIQEFYFWYIPAWFIALVAMIPVVFIRRRRHA